MNTYNKNSRNKQKSPTKEKINHLDELERIAADMDMIYRRRLPDGVIRYGDLGGREPEIRQEALIMAVGGFLHGHPGYTQARRMNDPAAMHAVMERCAALTLCYSKRRLTRASIHHTSRHTQVNENNGGACMHPSLLRPSDWPLERQSSAVMISVHRAVREGSLSAANAGIVAMVCDQGLRVREIARILGVDASAVSQQLRRVKQVLPEVLARVEVSWDF